MRMNLKNTVLKWMAWSLIGATTGLTWAADSETTPRPVPLTRPEMKRLLEDMKARKPRIPLPELSEEDREKLGERGSSYESRLRFHYLPGGRNVQPRPAAGASPPTPGGSPSGFAGASGFGGFGFAGAGGGRDSDPDMTLDYAFKTQLFWIVSRTNNCQYCLGHQESKLLSAGMTEDQIASLDVDWSQFSPAQQAAFAYARKITLDPHLLSDADLDGLRKHFTEKQILEMTLSIAGNNAINRWKEGAGIPQSAGGGNFGSRRAEASGPAAKPEGKAAERPAEKAGRGSESHSYLTPTSAQFQSVVTKVAPIDGELNSELKTAPTLFRRPPLESRAQVEAKLAEVRQRKPRLPLVDDAKTREFLPEGFPEGDVPKWANLLANFPNSAKSRIATLWNNETKGDLSPLIKAQASWIIARQDRAWYALAEAQQRLKALGQTDDQIFALDGPWDAFTPAERAAFTVAKKLAATPVVLTDAEVTEAVKQIGPRDVVQLISYTTHRASFDRVTEAAGL
ncbi:MAG: hypothetical protein U0939_02610 [Pirellulales bacterium]